MSSTGTANLTVGWTIKKRFVWPFQVVWPTEGASVRIGTKMVKCSPLGEYRKKLMNSGIRV